MTKELDLLRDKIDDINMKILDLLCERGEIVQEIGRVKEQHGILTYDPIREHKMMEYISEHNQGPFDTKTIQHIFKQIFKAGVDLQDDERQKVLLVSRKKKEEDTIVSVKDLAIGNGETYMVAGPCAVESYEQVLAAAKEVKAQGLTLFRGGAFKPRTSPYDFQGLGFEGLKMMRQAADECGLAVISEIMSPSDIEEALQYVDVIQIGARNMQNFDLLKAAGNVRKPVLLKRGLAATIEEFIYAAEYIMSQGNDQIILCERGIRTYERATRNTLDISAVPILKKETHLPVFVDVTHSTGRKDLLLPAAKAAIAIGADGIMAEVHPNPAVALSDSAQQMDFQQFDDFVKSIRQTTKIK